MKLIYISSQKIDCPDDRDLFRGGHLAMAPFGQKFFFDNKKKGKLGWPPPLYEQ